MNVVRTRRSIAVVLLVSAALALALVVASSQRAQAEDVPLEAGVALVSVRFNDGAFACSGFLVGPHTVATAGHCLHREGHGPPVAVTVYPGRDRSDMPQGAIRAIAWTASPGWTANLQDDADYGAVTLPVDLPGAFTLTEVGDRELLGRPIVTSGYPGHLAYGERSSVGARISVVEARELTYDVETTPGTSGSVVYLDGVEGRLAVGIHVGAYDRGTISVRASATRITSEILRFFDEEAGRSTAETPERLGVAPVTFRETAGRPVTLGMRDNWGPAWWLEESTTGERWRRIAQSGPPDSDGNRSVVIRPSVSAYYRVSWPDGWIGPVSRGIVDGREPGTGPATPPAATPTPAPTPRPAARPLPASTGGPASAEAIANAPGVMSTISGFPVFHASGPAGATFWLEVSPFGDQWTRIYEGQISSTGTRTFRAGVRLPAYFRFAYADGTLSEVFRGDFQTGYGRDVILQGAGMPPRALIEVWRAGIAIGHATAGEFGAWQVHLRPGAVAEDDDLVFTVNDVRADRTYRLADFATRGVDLRPSVEAGPSPARFFGPRP